MRRTYYHQKVESLTEREAWRELLAISRDFATWGDLELSTGQRRGLYRRLAELTEELHKRGHQLELTPSSGRGERVPG